MSETARAATPWWFWVIAILGLLWSFGGCYDYYMTQTENAEYLSQFTPEQLSYWENFPTWLHVFWALAVWGGLLGWLLMLVRHKFAYHAFIVSLVAMVVNFGYMLATGGGAIMGAAGMAFTGLIVLFAVFAVWYSRKMIARGILR